MTRMTDSEANVGMVLARLTQTQAFEELEFWDVESNDRDAVTLLTKALGDYYLLIKASEDGELSIEQRTAAIITATTTLLSLSALAYSGRYQGSLVTEAFECFKAAKAKHGDMTLETGKHTTATAMVAIGEELGEWCRALTYDEGKEEDAAEELAQFAGLVAAYSTWLLGDIGMSWLK